MMLKIKTTLLSGFTCTLFTALAGIYHLQGGSSVFLVRAISNQSWACNSRTDIISNIN